MDAAQGLEGRVGVRARAVAQAVLRHPVVFDRKADRPVAHHAAMLDEPAALGSAQLVDEAAAKLAWQRTVDWFNKYLRT